MSSEPIADPAFKVIPKNSTFFLIWRIEKLQVVAVPKDNYGTFYTGDSYIIAIASDGKEKVDSQMKTREAKDKLDLRIHFWLGAHTSQDEAGVAAYKTVELDDYFGGAPVQHREVQGHESNLFLSYFRNGIRLLDGGVASGFNHVEKVLKPRLFQVKGKRIPVVKQCKEIGWASMNKGDVFILDAVSFVFLWSGRTANHMEKLQGAKVVQQFKAEHGPECNGIVFVEDGNETSDLRGNEKEVFEKYLPLGKKNELKEETADVDAERKKRVQLTLYQCSDENGNLKVVEVKHGPLNQEDLKSNDSFIVDNGENGIWAWIGKKASKKERVEAMRNAQGFIAKKGYANHTQVVRVIDGGEPLDFKSLFKSWKEPNAVVGVSKTYSAGGRVASTKDIAKAMPNNKVDVALLHENHAIAAETQLIDDGAGDKKVYRVKSFDLVPVEEKDHGNFFSGDCYLIVYQSTVGRKVAIIYYWIGNNCSIDEKGTVAIKTVETDEKQFGGRAVQVRVVEGKEPPQFTAMFGGKMVIYKGGFKSGFRSGKKAAVEEVVHGDKYLLQVRGTNKYITRAIEVDCCASSLNSNDCFVLYTPRNVYVWAGKGSSGDEREMAKICASKEEGKEIVFVSEGQEKDDFWEQVGGRKEYAREKGVAVAAVAHPPRLFQCSNAKGYFTVEEIVDFQQTDLVEEDVMLLDAWDNIFLWIGSKSNADERKQAMETSYEYLRSDPSDRDLETPIIVVKQGNEPVNFTGFFGAWNHSLWSELNSFDNIKSEIANQGKSSALKLLSGNCAKDFNASVKYPVDVLRAKDPLELPENVDPSQKEIYLSNEEFNEVFAMAFAEYNALPKWKQIELKKKVGLF